ncbi:hypothetical protein Pan181_22630 [Aeoliella mucimassa]|uniref:Uncharacterized protein n=2 Tax=Aeoliella mucimassa TaxID=2527972 RepID=A0A518AMW2_9BACT|nr:hypothetical protein Pan181_22630 [Aeoliella mucimassa]
MNDAYTPVSQLLARLRGRIRTYVWAEAILLALVLLGVVFWGGLLVDWMFEPSPEWRMAAHVVVSVAVVSIIVWWGLRRWLVDLSDHSLALIIERKHPELADALSSAVYIHQHQDRDDMHPELARRTLQEAAEAVGRIDTDGLLNQVRLNRFALLVGGLAISVIALALGVPRVWDAYTERLALSPEQWPRTVSLEIDGFEPDGQGGFVRRVARNADVPLVVKASLAEGLSAPERVTIRYRWREGRRGRDDLVRIGDAQSGRDEAQRFEYLFERIASDVEFEIRGGDDRLRRLRLEVVERPKVTALSFECQYPAYLDRSDRSIPAGPRVELPEGTKLVAKGKANKPLSQIRWRRVVQTDDTPVITNEATTDFEKPLTVAADDMEMEVELVDENGISSAEPFRVTIVSREDELPQVLASRQGIGTAITYNAQVPVQLNIEDDYAVNSAWVDLVHDGESLPRVDVAMPAAANGEVITLATVDLAQLAKEHADDPLYQFSEGQLITITAGASDRYDLNENSRESTARPLSFEIVSEEDLMLRLAANEQNLRQTFESIADKLLLLYDSLEKMDGVASTDLVVVATAEATEVPSDEPDENELTEDADAQLAREAGRQAETARQIGDEVLGVAAGFEDIHAQLFNNRIENTELSDRIGNRIAAPLRSLGEQRMPQVAERIADLVNEGTLDIAKNETRQAIAEVEQLLREMQGLENYNEVIAMLREIIRQQDEINEKTKEQQKSNLRDLLLD